MIDLYKAHVWKQQCSPNMNYLKIKSFLVLSVWGVVILKVATKYVASAKLSPSSSALFYDIIFKKNFRDSSWKISFKYGISSMIKTKSVKISMEQHNMHFICNKGDHRAVKDLSKSFKG